MSRVQAAVIRNGTELEQMVLSRVQLVNDLDVFLSLEIMADGVQVVPKRVVKKCEAFDFIGAEPDLLIFKRRQHRQSCHVVELKEGGNFDTKKSSAEHANLHAFITNAAQHLQYTVHPHFCSFNQLDREAVYNGFKRKIPLEECMTGQEFCDLLEIDYHEIVNTRRVDQPINVRYFVEQLRLIPVVTEQLTHTTDD